MKSRLKDQAGAALVIALIMIVVLTLIGLASTFTSTFEISLSGNKRLSTDAFYDSETVRSATSAENLRKIKDLKEKNDSRIDPKPQDPDSDTKLSSGEITSGLDREGINDKWLINPNSIKADLTLPSGISFNEGSTINIYHSIWSPGQGSNNMKADTYIIDSIGTDNVISNGQMKSKVHLREKLVLHSPSADESQ